MSVNQNSPIPVKWLNVTRRLHQKGTAGGPSNKAMQAFILVDAQGNPEWLEIQVRHLEPKSRSLQALIEFLDDNFNELS